MTELGDKLGPMLWQFAPTKKFDEADFDAFLELLPDDLDGRTIRHGVEVRHDSFSTPAFAALLRKWNVPVVFADHENYPAMADVTGDFVYARLQTGSDDATAYPPKDLDAWAERLSLGRGRAARRPRLRRPRRAARRPAARGVRLHHPRGQGARPARRHGADRAAEG